MTGELCTYSNAVHGAQFGAHRDTEQLEASTRAVVRSTVVLVHATRQLAPVAWWTPKRKAACNMNGSIIAVSRVAIEPYPQTGSRNSDDVTKEYLLMNVISK